MLPEAFKGGVGREAREEGGDPGTTGGSPPFIPLSGGSPEAVQPEKTQGARHREQLPQ